MNAQPNGQWVRVRHRDVATRRWGIWEGECGSDARPKLAASTHRTQPYTKLILPTDRKIGQLVVLRTNRHNEDPASPAELGCDWDGELSNGVSVEFEPPKIRYMSSIIT